MTDKLKPQPEWFIVEAAPKEMMTKSGIIIPDTAEEKPQKGTVVATSDADKFKVGDEVLFSIWGSFELRVEDKKLLAVKQDNIFAIWLG